MKMKQAVTQMETVYSWIQWIRDRWMVVAFALSAILWVGEFGRVYVALPHILDEQMRALEALETRTSVLEDRVEQVPCIWLGCLSRRVGGNI